MPTGNLLLCLHLSVPLNTTHLDSLCSSAKSNQRGASNSKSRSKSIHSYVGWTALFKFDISCWWSRKHHKLTASKGKNSWKWRFFELVPVHFQSLASIIYPSTSRESLQSFQNWSEVSSLFSLVQQPLFYILVIILQQSTTWIYQRQSKF